MTSESPHPELPLRLGASGASVRDLHRRLTIAGHPTSGERYDEATVGAVRAFQADRGLTEDSVCGPETWAALVEAGYHLGDRLLYHRRPMLRGDDVGALQRRLAALGFDPGRVDSIFGPDTEAALQDFQRNAGITTDGVCGRDTLAALDRLGTRTDGHATVTELHQTEELRGLAGDTIVGRRLAVGETGDAPALVDAIAQRLTSAGARPLVLHHPDEHEHARRCNEFGAEAYVGLHVDDTTEITVQYFSVPGYTSIGGQRLATVVGTTLADVGWACRPPNGMRLPVLRETRMPAVRCCLGPPVAVVSNLDHLVGAIVEALQRWVSLPVTPSPDDHVTSPPANLPDT